MNRQPRRNEDRFYRYPKHRVVAIIDDDQLLETAVKHLDDAGIDLDTVHILSGPDGARLLDRSGKRHGFALACCGLRRAARSRPTRCESTRRRLTTAGTYCSYRLTATTPGKGSPTSCAPPAATGFCTSARGPSESSDPEKAPAPPPRAHMGVRYGLFALDAAESSIAAAPGPDAQWSPVAAPADALTAAVSRVAGHA
jgi:hypothetical protein